MSERSALAWPGSHDYTTAINSFERRQTVATKKLTSHRVEYSKDDIRQLKAMIKAKTPMTEIGKAMGRTAAGVRMKAYTLGILPKRKNKAPSKRTGR
jgi:hypothetical protein